MRTNWLPGSRTGQLAMAKVWAGALPAKASAWKITEADITGLNDIIEAAELYLAKMADKSGRTHVDRVNCEEEFKALRLFMRYLKNNFFNLPPRTAADLALLGLSPRDPASNVPPPEGFAEADVSYPGVGALELYCRPMAGQPPLDLKSDYGYRVYFGVMPQGGAGVEAATGVKRELMKVPLTGEELPHSQWVRRKKERFYFSGDSGKTGYFCVRYENGKGETGPWGPLFQAVIP